VKKGYAAGGFLRFWMLWLALAGLGISAALAAVAGQALAQQRAESPSGPAGPYSKQTPAGWIEYTEILTMEATAYYPGPESTGIWADGYTSTGLRAGHGVVAVDPEVIPLGTALYIPGYGLAVAADVGSAIKGNRIDLCFDTYEEALFFGRRPVEVYILTDAWVQTIGRELFPKEAFP